jgi:hypothetical protein
VWLRQVNSEDQLNALARKFLETMTKYNFEDHDIELEEIENWIQEDFISLDESLASDDLKM